MWWVLALAIVLAHLAPITIRNLDAQQPIRTLTRTDVSVGGTAIQLCPVNQSRVDCSCTNNDGGVAFRVGDTNITATRGQRVTGGGTFKATTTSAVFGISEGAAVAVSCTDQSR